MTINLRAPTLQAIKILKYMGERQREDPEGLVMGKDVAVAIKVTHSYFMRVAKELIRGGLLRSVQGRLGGFQLAKDLTDISLYEIMEVMEGESKPDSSLLDGLSTLNQRLLELSASLGQQLREVRISDV